MRYVTINVARFPAGAVLGLSKAQAAARRHAIKPRGGDRYETTAPVEFKAGEVFEYVGDLPKSLAAVIEQADRSKARVANKPSAGESETAAVKTADATAQQQLAAGQE